MEMVGEIFKNLQLGTPLIFGAKIQFNLVTNKFEFMDTQVKPAVCKV